MIKEFVNNKTNAMKAVARKVKATVIDKTSDAMSYPVRKWHNDSSKRSDRIYNETIARREESNRKIGAPAVMPKKPQEEAIKRKTVQIGTSTPAFKEYGDKGYNPVSKGVKKN